MSKKVLWVLMGGPAAEHEVSLVSGEGIVQNLNSTIYDVYPVFISKEYLWVWGQEPISEFEKSDFSAEWFLDKEGLHKEYKPALSQLPIPDMAFLALHGFWGEDGQVQALLNYWTIPFTGCDLLASALSMNKIKAKEIYKASNLPTPKSITCSDSKKLTSLIEGWNYPVFIKNPIGGSSLQMGKADSLSQAISLSESLLAECSLLLIEEFIEGREASCGYIENFVPLPPTEIKTTGFFDFEAKYRGESQEITPASFGSELNNTLSSLAKECHLALGCSVYSRTDFLIQEDGCIFILETNTLPGFTPQSLLPQQAAAVGTNYSSLLDIVIQESFKKYD